MEKQRTASLSVKQAFGILVLEFAAIFLFCIACTFFIFIFNWLSGKEGFYGIPSILGLILGESIVLFFVIMIIIAGIWLVRDKHGMKWKR